MIQPFHDHPDLPDTPTIEGLTLLIGEEALAQLSIDFGGSVVSIPTKIGEHSPLAYSIGEVAARRMAEVWGGMQFTVPLQVGKTQRIIRLLKEGKSINRICRIVGVSRPTVYRTIAAEDNKKQFDMFGM